MIDPLAGEAGLVEGRLAEIIQFPLERRLNLGQKQAPLDSAAPLPNFIVATARDQGVLERPGHLPAGELALLALLSTRQVPTSSRELGAELEQITGGRNSRYSKVEMLAHSLVCNLFDMLEEDVIEMHGEGPSFLYNLSPGIRVGFTNEAEHILSSYGLGKLVMSSVTQEIARERLQPGEITIYRPGEVIKLDNLPDQVVDLYWLVARKPLGVTLDEIKAFCDDKDQAKSGSAEIALEFAVDTVTNTLGEGLITVATIKGSGVMREPVYMVRDGVKLFFSSIDNERLATRLKVLRPKGRQSVDLKPLSEYRVTAPAKKLPAKLAPNPIKEPTTSVAPQRVSSRTHSGSDPSSDREFVRLQQASIKFDDRVQHNSMLLNSIGLAIGSSFMRETLIYLSCPNADEIDKMPTKHKDLLQALHEIKRRSGAMDSLEELASYIKSNGAAVAARSIEYQIGSSGHGKQWAMYITKNALSYPIPPLADD